MKVTVQQIEEIITSLTTYAEQMQDVFTEIKNEMSKVGQDGSVWSGDAAASERDRFDALSKNFEPFHDAIVNCYKHLEMVVADNKALANKISSQS